MKPELRLKGKFTQKWLKDSDEYYSPLYLRLFYAQYNYFQSKGIKGRLEELVSIENSQKIIESYGDEVRAATFIEGGFDDFAFIFESINSCNRAFIKLLEANEPLAALAMIRLQLDNLTYLLAELQHPFKILYKVYIKGYRLNQILINGKKLNPSEIRKEYETKYPNQNIHTLYDKYSGFIHPDSVQLQFTFLGGNNPSGKLTKKKIKELTKDMVHLNQIISHQLICQIAAFNIEYLHRFSNR